MIADQAGPGLSIPSLSIPSLSIVVPCYNESECLRELHQRVTAAAVAAVGRDYELILVNDGSRDDSWRIMRTLAAEDPRLVVANLARNAGHQLALTAGLSICRGEAIFIIDADLQDPPELLTPMLATMRRESADVVYGQRRTRAGESAFKKLTAAGFYRLLGTLSDVEIPLDTGDFRLMSRRALDVFLAMPEAHRFVRGMVAWIGMRQVAFPYEREARFAGETNYPLSKMIQLTFDALTGFSTAPLRLASHLGLALGVLGLLLMVYILGSWLSGSAIQGWTSLMVVVVLLGSCQMLVIGVLGEYLGRLYMQSKDRPLFVIQDLVAQADVAAAIRHTALGVVSARPEVRAGVAEIRRGSPDS